MAIRLFALPCGWLEASLSLFLEGAPGRVRVPVPSWLVLHPRGAVVFDTHLHFDHVGGNAQLPNATLVVQRREWEAAADPDLRAKNGYDPRDYDLGQPRRLVDGEHDLFGDGTVTCLPTFGHTAGHQSLRVQLPSGPVVLTADACYLRRTLETLALPPVVHDRDAMLASLRGLRALEAAGARLYFGHDPAPWHADPRAVLEVA
jgi:glyoxylase-like metal-dependent hydrolase (beta-lactamase superfamily II)